MTLVETLNAMPVLDSLERTEATLIHAARWRKTSWANNTGKTTATGWVRKEAGWAGGLWTPSWYKDVARSMITIAVKASTYSLQAMVGILTDDSENGIFFRAERYNPAEHAGNEYWGELSKRIEGVETVLKSGWFAALNVGDKIAISHDPGEAEGLRALRCKAGTWEEIFKTNTLSEVERAKLGEQAAFGAGGNDTTFRLTNFSAGGTEEETLSLGQRFFNTNFENWTGPMPKRWYKEGAGTISKETVLTHGGTKAVKGVSAAGQQVEVYQTAPGVAANTLLKFTAWQRLAESMSTHKIRVCIKAIGGAYEGYWLNFSTGSWQAGYTDACSIFPLWYTSYREIAYQFKSPPEEVGIRVYVGRWAEGTTTFYADDVTLSEVTALADSTAVSWGMYHNGWPEPTSIEAAEKAYGHSDYIGYYRYWGNKLMTEADIAAIGTSIPVISLEREGPSYKPSVGEIAAGTADAYLDEQGTILAAYGKTVILRPLWEMNIGYEFPEGKRPDPNEYIAAFKRIRERISAKAPLVKFFWCPNVDTDLWGQNDFFAYFPGDAVVDYVGADGYANSLWNTEKEEAYWKSLHDVFYYTYNCLAALSEKPFIIGEVGTAAGYGSTATWIKQGFLEAIPKYPRMAGVLYFDFTGFVPDWSLSESEAKQAAFVEVAKSAVYRNTPIVVTGSGGNGRRSLRVNATVDPNGTTTKYRFDYWVKGEPGVVFSTSEVEDGKWPGVVLNVEALIRGLAIGTTYEFCIVAENSDGSSEGLVSEFTTESIRRSRKPPLALDVEVETPEMTFRLSADAKRARDRVSQLSFSTQRGDGFATGSALLHRDIFRDYADLNLLDTWRFVSHDGEVAYEGRLHSFPRTNDPDQQFQVSLVGWMTYLKNRRISPLIIDRRLSSWIEPTLTRQAYLLECSYGGRMFNLSVEVGEQSGGESYGAGLRFTLGVATPSLFPIGCRQFYGGGEDIGGIIFDFRELTKFGTDPNFNDIVCLAENDKGAVGAVDLSINYHQTTTLNQFLTAAGSNRKWAEVQVSYQASLPAGGYTNTHAWLNMGVIGRHGLTVRGTNSIEKGFYVSDVIEYILKTYYPKIQWVGKSNAFVLPQATWHDNPSDGYSIIQQLNELILWETNVWEERKFYFEAADFSKYDWQVRTDDPGVTVLFQGDSIENFANGVPVTYEDFAGIKHTLWPPDHPELRDDSEDNPANRHGEYNWPSEIPVVPFPCLEPEALQFGRAYLAEYNRPKRPGTYRLAGGYIRDAAGNWQQGWKVRNSQTIGIMDLITDEPRLITATNWDQESKSLEITVDAPPQLLDAVIGRMMLALEARGLR